MVSLRFWKLLWILVIFFVLAQIIDSKKHRAQHSHHHHRHHRKQPKIHHHHRLHQSSAKDISRERNKRSHFTLEFSNGTKLSTTHRLWSLNETSTPISLIGNISNNDKIKLKLSVMKNATVKNFDNSTSNSNLIINGSNFFSRIETLVTFNMELKPNDLYVDESTVDNREIPSLSTKNETNTNLKTTTALLDPNHTLNISSEFSIIQNVTNLPRNESRIFFTQASDVIDKSTWTQSVTKASRLDDPHDDNGNDIDNRELVKDLQKLFGPTEKDRKFIEIEAPVVTLIRKKRALKEDEENPEKKSLLDFNGPAILKDPEEMGDWRSLHDVHKRVKRDRPSEFDEDPSVMSSRESNYLQDLEDSFAPSALEIQAQRAQNRNSRMSRQVGNRPNSLLDKLRIKRNAKEEKDEEENVNEPAESSESSSSLFKDDSSSEKQFELNHPDISSSFDSTLTPKQTEQNSEVNERMNKNDVSTDPLKSSSVNSYLENDESTLKKYLEDEVHPKNISNFDSFSSTIETTGNSVENETNEEKKRDSSLPQKSASEMSYLKDDGSISRIGLDDVYPDIIEDPKHPSAFVQHVRTKRFGNAFVEPEARDDSYGNEADVKTADGPYAEDNRFIDSALSKVDYRTMNGQNGYLRTGNVMPYKKEINVQERPEVVHRGKRESGFSKRMRKKSGQGLHGNRKHSKKHRGKKRKKKKKHRTRPKSSKIKRASDYDLGGHFYDTNEPEIISPHDGRRRRDYEDENEENFHLDNDDSSGQFRRDSRESEDHIRRIPIENYEKYDISRSVEGRDKILDDTRTRAKRDNALQELKYYENIRETDGGQKNHNGQEKVLLGQRAAGPIRDIKQLAQELLDKVNELHGYVNESIEADGHAKESHATGTFSSTRIIRTTDTPTKIIQKTTSLGSVEKSTQSEVNAMKRRESCAKSLTTSNGKPSRSGGSSVKPNEERSCGKKVRRKRKSHRKWDRWTDWSSCSVTCGRGRQIRWRHCVRNCSTAETEMEEKACQLPACAPGKFLGIFG